MIHEALHFIRLNDNRVECQLCPAFCRLRPGQRGICHSRYNDGGTLLTDNFGETVTIAVDPIEKKPLYHFLPGTDILSIGPNGCNLSCRHCQNWQISQEETRTVYIAPERLPEIALEHGSVGVAYTYTEPMIWYEYILEAAPLVKKAGLVNVMVSNGYINPGPLESLLPLIDAYNIDLKGMKPEFYRRVCKGKLEPVLDVIRILTASRAHLEVTYLVIPGLNDGDEDFHALTDFLADCNPLIPLHFSAYHPSYKLDNPPTPRKTLERAYAMAKKRLSHVFVGNMEIRGCSDTCCPACGQTQVERNWYSVRVSGVTADGNCAKCGRKSDMIMDRI